MTTSASTETRSAVGYCRVSGESQVDGDGILRQMRVIGAWSVKAGVHIERFYKDLAVSGTKAADERPAMAEMIGDLTASGGQPPIVVIERSDRLARDLIESELIVRRLQALGVSIVIAETGQPFNEDTSPTGVLIRQLLSAVAQFDKSSIVAKLRSARVAKRFQTGRCEGRKPYGSRPGEETGLEMIRQCRAAGDTYDAIAKKLDAAGVETRGGKPWTRAAILKIARRDAEDQATLSLPAEWRAGSEGL